MNTAEYIESMNLPTTKEFKKIKKMLSKLHIHDWESGIREIIVPKGFNIPFRGNLYGWEELMHTSTVKTFEIGAWLVIDDYGQLWLRIHRHDSQHDDDPEVFFPVENADEAEAIFDKEGPFAAAKYFVHSLEDLSVPHFRYNDGPYLYFATKDLTLSEEEMFDRLVACNIQR
jgi:hypothetical protein